MRRLPGCLLHLRLQFGRDVGVALRLPLRRGLPLRQRRGRLRLRPIVPRRIAPRKKGRATRPFVFRARAAYAWLALRASVRASSSESFGPSSVTRASCVSAVRKRAMIGFSSGFTWVSS